MSISIKDKVLNNTPENQTDNSDTIQSLDERESASTVTANDSQNFNESLIPTDLPSEELGKTGHFAYEGEVEVERYSTKAAPKFGSGSIFNPYSVFTHPNAKTANDFLDIKGQAGAFPKGEKVYTNGDGKEIHIGGRKLTIESLLEDFQPNETNSKPYFATDFFFGKYWRKIPLNHIITLRRFPFPTYDNLEFGKDSQGKVTPVAQAVTYFGEPTGNELNELTKFSGTINWEELTADVHDVEGNEVDQSKTPFLGGIGGVAGTAITAANVLGNPGKQDLGGFKQDQIDAAHYSGFEYTNKVLGPVNVIHKTHTRGRGIGANWKTDLVFEYELKSFNGINPRIAMLDLLCNMLALTFNNAKFWGGANRYFPNQPQFAFIGDEAAFYRGDYGSYVGSVIQHLGSGLGAGLSILGNLVSSILGGNLAGITDIAKGGANVLFDLQRQKSRPKVLGFHALLTGLPVGEWHMVLGNPYRPILTMGNLICEGFDMEFGGHLGVDDFPSELKFIVKLKQGRPRDKGDLESGFNLGEGRVYYPPKGLIDTPNQTASTSNSPANATGGSGQSTKGNQPVTPASTVNTVPSQSVNRRGFGANDDYSRKLIGTVF